MKKLLSLLLACISITCFSCGHDSPADEVSELATEATTEEITTESETEQNEVSAFVGKWQGVKIIEDGKESDIFEDIPVYACYQFELCEDGSVKLGETTAKIAGHENSWKWNRTSKSNEIEFFDSEDDYDINILTLDGDYLVYTENDDILYLEKVEEFTPYQLEEETTEPETEQNEISAFVGKWQGMKIIDDGEEELDELNGIPIYAMFQIELFEDGSVAFSRFAVPDITTLKWRRLSSPTEIEFFSADVDDTDVFTLDGDYLIFTDEDSNDQLYLEKVDEFTPYQPEEETTDTETTTEETSAESETEQNEISEFVGKWQSQKAIQNGNELDYAYGVPVNTAYQFELNEDGSAVVNGVLGSNWRYFGNEVEINLNTGAIILLYQEDEFLAKHDNEIDFYLERVEEFVPSETGDKIIENVNP